MTLLLSDDEVRRACLMPEVVEAVQAGLLLEARGGVASVPRLNLPLSGGFFRLMPAVIEELDVMGFKCFDAKDKAVRYVVALYRASTGELDCLLDAAYLTAARTGATTAVATRLMTAEESCREVGVIGSGLEAWTNLEAICCVRGVGRVVVYSPSSEHRRRFAERARRDLGLEAVAAETAAEAAAAPFVLAATNTGSNGPVALAGRWLGEDAVLATIGATAPVLHEVDPDTFRRAAAVVLDTEHAPAECGDIIAAEEEGAWPPRRLETLVELVELDAGGRAWERPAGLSVFKSVGTATQDLTAGRAVAARARALGLGREVEVVAPKLF